MSTPPKPLSTRARRLIGDNDQAGSPLPDQPTAALPGTAEKEAIITARIAAGQGSYHPDDLTLSDAQFLGYTFSIDVNGRIQWRRPVSELARRELLLTALAARRRGE